MATCKNCEGANAFSSGIGSGRTNKRLWCDACIQEEHEELHPEDGNLICGKCECNTYKLLPNPTGELNSEGQKELICEDCEYEISCTLDSMNDEPIEKYEDRRGS